MADALRRVRQDIVIDPKHACHPTRPGRTRDFECTGAEEGTVCQYVKEKDVEAVAMAAEFPNEAPLKHAIYDGIPNETGLEIRGAPTCLDYPDMKMRIEIIKIERRESNI
jgi:hypothetical protein